MGRSTDLWKKARQIIPGGNQLLSKRAEMFLPGQWPAYYEKAKGVEVWDLDGKKYIDMSIMGIGCCVLGYANEEMDRAVKAAIDKGVASSLNAPEEVYLAEKLIALHPWASMVRFAKTGGEINAIALRIARAYSRKDKVAFCGYHGWHDWYLASNLADESSLDGQLLPGLKPAGVPRALKGTSHPFRYGHIEDLEAIVQKSGDEIGTVMMEFTKYGAPDLEFIRKVRVICDKIGAVLIFDEVSSGFRATVGGVHRLYDIVPDMITLAKAMGNGYPIAAVIGKREVMEAAQESFISSTNWTERTGLVAALETIRQYESYGVAEHTVKVADYIREGLRRIIKKHGLNIDIGGMPSIVVLAIKEKESLEIKSVFTQEMLKKGFLAANVIFVSLAHTVDIADKFFEAADEVLGRIALANRQGNVASLLEGPLCHGAFKRLN